MFICSAHLEKEIVCPATLLYFQPPLKHAPNPCCTFAFVKLPPLPNQHFYEHVRDNAFSNMTSGVWSNKMAQC